MVCPKTRRIHVIAALLTSALLAGSVGASERRIPLGQATNESLDSSAARPCPERSVLWLRPPSITDFDIDDGGLPHEKLALPEK